MRTLRESLLDDFGSQAADLRKEQIKEWLEKHNYYGTHGLKFNPDGTIDIDDFVYKEKGNFPDFIQFNRCDADFMCSNRNMTSLRGCPKEVGGSFYCSNNQLKTLKGSPEKVGGNFYCYGNQLTSLEGSPKEVGGSFNCSINKLTSLKGSPEKVGGNFYCYNNQLTSLRDGPKEVGGSFYCSDNPLSADEIKWTEKNIKCKKFIWK